MSRSRHGGAASAAQRSSGRRGILIFDFDDRLTPLIYLLYRRLHCSAGEDIALSSVLLLFACLGVSEQGSTFCVEVEYKHSVCRFTYLRGV